MNLDERENARSAVLNALYRLSNSDTLEIVDPNLIAKELRLGFDDVMSAIQYLQGEHLAEIKVFGGGSSITHAGIKRVEASAKASEPSRNEVAPSRPPLEVSSLPPESTQPPDEERERRAIFSAEEMFEEPDTREPKEATISRRTRAAVAQTNKLSAPSIYKLKPVAASDRPNTTDDLGFEAYVQALADFLGDEGTRTPITLSVEGDWGSGKSTFMLHLRERLRRGGHTTVAFNAWRYDKDEALWANFALEVTKQLKEQAPFALARTATLLYSRVHLDELALDSIKALLPILPPAVIAWTAILPKVLPGVTSPANGAAFFGLLVSMRMIPALGRVKEFFANPFSIDLAKYIQSPDYSGKIPFLERFHEDFAKVIRAYVPAKKKLFVFIDDLDRCEAPKAADLLQALNLMIPDDSESQLVFILGLDRAKVAMAIASKSEKLLPFIAPPKPTAESGRLSFDPAAALEFGHSFLDKFIQLPFRIPQATEVQLGRMMGRVEESLASPARPAIRSETLQPGAELRGVPQGVVVQISSADSPLLRELCEMVAPALDYNPRRLKQFVNLFKLRAHIASRTGLFGTEEFSLTLEKLAKFVAIGMKWPQFLKAAAAEEELVGELEPLPTHNSKDKKSSSAEEWSHQDALMKLLAHGTTEIGTWMTFTLRKLDFGRLLRISPPVSGGDAGAGPRLSESSSTPEKAVDDRASGASPRR